MHGKHHSTLLQPISVNTRASPRRANVRNVYVKRFSEKFCCCATDLVIENSCRDDTYAETSKYTMTKAITF